jgi:hypothetical protein
MKDTLTKKSTYYDTHIKTSETVRNDINGIYKELIEYNKLQRQEKAGVSSDTIYTVKITLFIFILGIFIERLIKFADKKNKDTDQKKFFLFHLNQANNLLFKKLKEVYKKLHDDISIDTGLESTPPKVISSDFQRLLNLNHEELFKAYKNKNVLSKILGQIEFVDKIQIEVNKFHDRVLQDSGNLRDNLENQSDEYLSLLSRYIEWEKLNNLQCENS